MDNETREFIEKLIEYEAMKQKIEINRAKRGAPDVEEIKEKEEDEHVFWDRFWGVRRDCSTDDEFADDEYESEEEDHLQAKEYSPPSPSYTPERDSDVDTWPYIQPSPRYLPLSDSYSPPSPCRDRDAPRPRYAPSPSYSPLSDSYSPPSPCYSPHRDRDSPSPRYAPLSDSYDSASPCYLPLRDRDSPSPCDTPLSDDVFSYGCYSPPPAEDRKRKHDWEDEPPLCKKKK